MFIDIGMKNRCPYCDDEFTILADEFKKCNYCKVWWDDYSLYTWIDKHSLRVPFGCLLIVRDE